MPGRLDAIVHEPQTRHEGVERVERTDDVAATRLRQLRNHGGHQGSHSIVVASERRGRKQVAFGHALKPVLSRLFLDHHGQLFERVVDVAEIEQRPPHRGPGDEPEVRSFQRPHRAFERNAEVPGPCRLDPIEIERVREERSAMTRTPGGRFELG